MNILVTGAAGFIGFHLVKRLIAEKHQVTGLDNLNGYYDVNLKYGRLSELGINQEDICEGLSRPSPCTYFNFLKGDITNKAQIDHLFKTTQFDVVVNLAAQAGVRYSLENPQAYIDSNVNGFMNILEACRHNEIGHLVYASSSSVYGLNEKMPFSTSDHVDHPVSLYAATKKSNELMAHCYSHLYDIPTTGLRFFTVYGPWGRPDMAPFLFTDAILNKRPIKVFNHGNMKRDFTYIDDIVEGVLRVVQSPPEKNSNWNAKVPNPSFSSAPYKIFNIGNNKPIKLLDFIKEIENALGIRSVKNMMDIQPGDVEVTWADVSDLIDNLGYKPNTPLSKGVYEFVTWYKNFYGEV